MQTTSNKSYSTKEVTLLELLLSLVLAVMLLALAVDLQAIQDLSIQPTLPGRVIETFVPTYPLPELISTNIFDYVKEHRDEMIVKVNDKEGDLMTLHNVETVEVIPEHKFVEGKLTPTNGTVMGPSGIETYYNLPMLRVIEGMADWGYSYDDYFVRMDGVKMLGDYIMCAADLEKFPRGTILETSLGPALVCDACEAGVIDIAVTW